jgi:isocitrate dehydrogenase
MLNDSVMSTKIPITVAYGDGIGPEIMEASLHVIPASGAQLDPETIEIGEKVYAKAIAAGFDIVKTETLRTYDGQQGLTLAQGQ